MTDVIIIGAGPAGCSAALTLLSEGLTVNVLDLPKHRESPTETTPSSFKSLLERVGATAALSECEPCFGFSSSWGRTASVFKPTIFQAQGHGWFIHRTDFDSSLKKLVLAAGGNWINGRATSPDLEGPDVAVTVNGVIHRSKFLVIASGSSSSAGNFTGQKHVVHDSLVTLWSQIPKKSDARLLFIEPTENGWWYACPSRIGETFACFMTDAQTVMDMNLRKRANWLNELSQTVISRHIASACEPGEILGASIFLSELPNRYGENWIAVGDAAMKLDPLGGAGLETAIESGNRAGFAIKKLFVGSNDEMPRYERWSKGLFAEFLKQRLSQYSQEGRKRNAPFWHRRVHRGVPNLLSINSAA